ncbi:hypothetical protein VTO58DRAFT_100576 [Aureobasidium pullulans]|nr:hypothetical protein JADG_010159 [Aureobasidium pullulans]
MKKKTNSAAPSAESQKQTIDKDEKENAGDTSKKRCITKEELAVLNANLSEWLKKAREELERELEQSMGQSPQ